MGRSTKRNLDEVLEAIEGSGGVKAVIARRLGVTRQTVDSYLDRWVTARELFGQEEAGIGDVAKSIVVGNLRALYNAQQQAAQQGDWKGAVVDTGDAKWWLKMKLRDEFSERQEITGADGEALKVFVDWDSNEQNDSD